MYFELSRSKFSLRRILKVEIADIICKRGTLYSYYNGNKKRSVIQRILHNSESVRYVKILYNDIIFVKYKLYDGIVFETRSILEDDNDEINKSG